MRDRYIRMRNSSGIDWQFIYDYAVSKGYTGGVQNFNIASNYLSMVMEQIIDQLDREYDIISLHGVDGKFIKIIT